MASTTMRLLELEAKYRDNCLSYKIAILILYDRTVLNKAQLTKDVDFLCAIAP